MCPTSNDNNLKMELTTEQLESMRFLSQVSQLSAYNIAHVLGGLLATAAPPNNNTLLVQPPPHVATTTTTSHGLTERQHCFLFIKVLLAYLAKRNLVSLRHRTRRVIAKCIHAHRQQGFLCRGVTLADTLDYEIRNCIGDAHWHTAQRGLARYCTRAGLRVNTAACSVGQKIQAV